MISDCQGHRKMTDWEDKFLDSIEERLEEDKHLTPAQIETLEKIWNKTQ